MAYKHSLIDIDLVGKYSYYLHHHHMIHQDLIPLVFELAIFYNSQILPPRVREGNFSSIHGKIGLRFSSYLNVQVC